MSNQVKPIDIPDQLLTPAELADRLKVAERTVYREHTDGKIPGRTVRGKLRFYWPEVLAALPVAIVQRQGIDRTNHRGPVDFAAILKERAQHWGGRR